MKNFVKGILLYSLLALSFPVFAGRPQIKYGNIAPEDFSSSAYTVDSSASGVVLFDVGSSSYEGDTHGGFSIIYKRHTRIRLLNRNSLILPPLLYRYMRQETWKKRSKSLKQAHII